MLNLTANLPDVLTEAIVVPAPVAIVEGEAIQPSRGFPMRRDDEVEAIAMDVAMRYERSRGWTPTDVSQDGEHYDIRSEGPNGEKRYIEVKGRAQSGAIVLTGPEVDKLRQLGERAWLYVVTFCKSRGAGFQPAGQDTGRMPVLRIIQDLQYYRRGREICRDEDPYRPYDGMPDTLRNRLLMFIANRNHWPSRLVKARKNQIQSTSWTTDLS